MSPPDAAAQEGIEIALKKSEARFRLVVEAAPSAMVMIRATGQIEMVNAQAERVFGYSRTELLDQFVEMLVPERCRGQHPTARGIYFDNPQLRRMGGWRDLFGLRKDGSEFPVEVDLTPIETEDGPMVLSVIFDVSERKQREERVLAALKEKDLLLSEIHHRVKNNLQVIQSLLDLQSSKITDGVALQMLTESQNRIKSMSLIHQTLYESKDFARVDFGSFLESLVPSLVSSYGTDPRRVTLSIDCSEIRLPIDAAIPCGLIVNELISNALKHAFPGGNRGEIKIALASEADNQVVLSVGDDGIGIPDSLDLTNATTLGLQLVTLLADQLGAAVTIHRSNPTRFVLQFKVKA